MIKTTMSAALAALIGTSAGALAQDWPTRPITLVVPFAAGGGLDVSVRIQAQHMSELLGQSIVIENVGAAAGMVGGQRVGEAPVVQDIIGGRIDYMCATIQTGAQQVKEGTVKGIAVMAEKRVSIVPDVATTGEQGD